MVQIEIGREPKVHSNVVDVEIVQKKANSEDDGSVKNFDTIDYFKACPPQ